MNRREWLQLSGLGVAGAAFARQSEPRYDEKYRPQFHFTPRKGWTNDPNGLVYYEGEYHLFFQHNPFDVKWGNMTWGHAVSPDMVHWRQVENALLPDRMGTMFSGSAVVDEENTAGFQQGADKPIVLIYTAAGDTSPESKGQPFTQCIAYSTDRGRTFTKYAGNPVVPHIVGGNRDPKVVWHAPTRRWIMALFLDANTYGFLASPDLKHWTLQQKIGVPGVAECPDFFEIPVDGEPGVTKWVWTGANANYLIGGFDGKRFVPEAMTQPLSYGANYYAVQTFSHLPGNRRVQVAWMQGGNYPGMPFNQQMSCPYELKLRKYGYESYRLFALPVKEIEALRESPKQWTNLTVQPGENPLAALSGDAWDVCAEIDPGDAKLVGFRAGGRIVSYAVKENTLHNGNLNTRMALDHGRLRLRVLADRASVEVFGNDGEIVMPGCFLPEAGNNRLEFFASGGAAKLVRLDVYALRSIWRS